MAGYVLKGITPINNVTVTSANIDVFTVPAGHIYLLKHFDMYLETAGTTPTTSKVQVSLADGTTFYDLTGVFSTATTTGNTKMISLALPESNVAEGATPSTTTGSRSAIVAGHNMIFEEGQKLRVVKTGAASGVPVTRIFSSVVDYTI